MVTKMHKYSFIILNEEIELFLTELQGLGIVDITRSEKPIDEKSMEMLATMRKSRALTKDIKTFLAKEHEDLKPIKTDIPKEGLISEIESLFLQRGETFSLIKSLLNDRREAEAWGDFTQEQIDKITDLGYDIHYYAIPEKKFSEELAKEYIIQEINRVNKKVYLVALSPKGESFKFPFIEAKAPSCSISILNERIRECEEMFQEIEGKLLGLEDYLPILNEISAESSENLDLYLATDNAGKEAEERLYILEGFAPVQDADRLEKEFENNRVLFIRDEATMEDNPPIKLKNNWFSRAFEPIGALYVPPKYNEVDMTRFYAPFYMMFFGLCLGDMGYGLVLIALGLIAKIKMPKFSAFAKLIIWLGVGSTIMPILTGTFFGTKVYDLLNMPESISKYFLTDINMFWLALVFGIVQLVIARLLNAYGKIKNEGFPNGLNEIGWAVLLVWVAFWYAGVETGNPIMSKPVSMTLLFSGLILLLFFTKTKGNILKRLVSGIANVTDIPTFLGDILSYIRLFGLGLSGGCLGMVVNSLALQLADIPYAGWLLTIILLLFGHTLVLLLSCIGAFVHPLRLTFVEFYKNSGFEGGGREYRPLKKS